MNPPVTIKSPDPYSHRAIWAIALPMIVSSVSVPLVGLVGTGVLGHLDDPVYLAAVAAGRRCSAILFVGTELPAHGNDGHPRKRTGPRDRSGGGHGDPPVTGGSRRHRARFGVLIVLLQAPIARGALGLIGAEQDVTGYAASISTSDVWERAGRPVHLRRHWLADRHAERPRATRYYPAIT